MKRHLLMALVASLFLLPNWNVQSVAAAEIQLPKIDAASYIMMDFETGVVLTDHQSHQARPPASMTKIMSEFVILDEIKKGKRSWDELVTVSPRAAAIDEAQVWLVPNEKLSLKELFQAMAIQSANDATVALAEHIAGSEEQFVNMMNRKAKEIGMSQTHFWNSTGLNKESYPDPPKGNEKHVMSAYDTAIMARELIQTHPDVLRHTSLSHYVFLPGTARERRYPNWNLMLPGLELTYKGVDGFKTGFTNAAGYCFTGTAKREGMRLITVVMDTPTKKARFAETKKLLDYGFDHFEVSTLVDRHQPVPDYEQVEITHGLETHIAVGVENDLRLPIQTENQADYTYHVHIPQPLKAPISKGTVIGEVQVQVRGEEIPGLEPVPLITKQDMEQASFLRLWLRQLGEQLDQWFSFPDVAKS